MLLGAAVTAGILYARFLPHVRFLFDEFGRDRNAHLLLSMQLAQDLRQMDLLQWLRDINTAKVWPPLHGLVLSLVLAAGGMRPELGVLLNLAAWSGTVVLAALVARRLCPGHTDVAGYAAALCTAVSPALAAFAADIMLESLGGLLTMLCCYFYLRCRQDGGERAARRLALALTALLLCKYNYYLLVFAGLLAGDLATQGGRRLAALAPVWRWATTPPALRRQLVNPLNYAAFTLLGIAGWIVVGGGCVLSIGGRTFSMTSPANVLQAAMIVVTLRLAIGWWAHRAGLRSIVPAGHRILLAWHALPAALWFSLPKRLGAFLFYVSAQNTPVQHGGMLDALSFYVDGFAHDYHAQAWVVAPVLFGLMLAAIPRSGQRPGAPVMLIVLLVAAVATLAHPHHQLRFLYTCMPLLWAVSAAGLSGLLGRLVPARRRALAGGGLALGLLAVSGPCLPALRLPPPHLAPWRNSHSTLFVTDAYLDQPGGAEHAALFATIPIQHQLAWTHLQRHPDSPRPEVMLEGFGADAAGNERRFSAWMARTPARHFVLVDIPVEATFHYGRYAHFGQYRRLLLDSPDLEATSRLDVVEGDWRAAVHLLRRAPAAGSQATAADTLNLGGTAARSYNRGASAGVSKPP